VARSGHRPAHAARLAVAGRHTRHEPKSRATRWPVCCATTCAGKSKKLSIRAWSDFALTTTSGDPLQWAAAHFGLTKAARTPRLRMSAPRKFVAASGPTKGSSKLRQNAQAGAKAYVYEYAPVPADASSPAWQYCLGTTATCVESGLTSERHYLCRAAACNGLGEMPCATTEARYVQ
jgi:hypothetical protein